MKAVLAIGLMAAFVTQCGYYVRDSDRNKDTDKEQQKQDEKDFKDRQNCDLGPKTGCVTGQLGTTKVTLDGAEYFDANTLVRAAASKLPLVDDKGSQLVAGRDFEATLVQPLTNETFPDNFFVYVRGDETRAPSAVTSKGAFKINYLDAGVYDISAQRKFDLKVADKRVAVTTQTDGQPNTVKEEPKGDRALCLVVYGEAKAVEISRNARQTITIDHYKTELLDKACSDAGAKPTLSL